MTRLHPVQRSFGIPIKIQADMLVDRVLPIETKNGFRMGRSE
jgi:hypothetical protein